MTAGNSISPWARFRRCIGRDVTLYNAGLDLAVRRLVIRVSHLGGDRVVSMAGFVTTAQDSRRFWVTSRGMPSCGVRPCALLRHRRFSSTHFFSLLFLFPIFLERGLFNGSPIFWFGDFHAKVFGRSASTPAVLGSIAAAISSAIFLTQSKFGHWIIRPAAIRWRAGRARQRHTTASRVWRFVLAPSCRPSPASSVSIRTRPPTPTAAQATSLK